MGHPRKLDQKPSHYFALVTFKDEMANPDSIPEVYIVPSTKVKELWTPWSGRPDVMCITYPNLKKHPELKDSRGLAQLFREQSAR